jgi:hypothetical protein
LSGALTVDGFIRKLRAAELKERSASQEHFIGCLRPGSLCYSDELENIVSEKHDLGLGELREPRTLQKLKWAMSDPEKLRLGKTRQDLTEDAAAEFAAVAQNLRTWEHDPGKVAPFINRLVFCMFAEDADLLPDKMFVRMLEAATSTPGEFQKLASSLFAAMKDAGLIGFERIDWFNGGLFDNNTTLLLTADDIALCLRAAVLNWSEIDPSILGHYSCEASTPISGPRREPNTLTAKRS